MPYRQRTREPAAIHLAVGDRSSISYTLPMVTGPSGYQPVLEVHLDTITVTSSLNDIRLVTAESCRVGLLLFFNSRQTLRRHYIGSLRTSYSTEMEYGTNLACFRVSSAACALPHS